MINRSEEEDVYRLYRTLSESFVKYLKSVGSYDIDNAPLWQEMKILLDALKEVDPVTLLCKVDLDDESVEKYRKVYATVHHEKVFFKEIKAINERIGEVSNNIASIDAALESFNKPVDELVAELEKEGDATKAEFQRVIDGWENAMENETDEGEKAYYLEKINQKKEQLAALPPPNIELIKANIIEKLAKLGEDKSILLAKKTQLAIKKELVNEKYKELASQYHSRATNVISQMVFFENMLRDHHKRIPDTMQDVSVLKESLTNLVIKYADWGKLIVEKKEKKANKLIDQLIKKYPSDKKHALLTPDEKEMMLTPAEKEMVKNLKLDWDKLEEKGANTIIILMMSMLNEISPQTVPKLKEEIEGFKKTKEGKHDAMFNQIVNDKKRYASLSELNFLNTDELTLNYENIKSLINKIDCLNQFNLYSKDDASRVGYVVNKLSALKDDFVTHLQDTPTVIKEMLTACDQIRNNVLADIKIIELQVQQGKIAVDEAAIQIKNIHAAMERDLRNAKEPAKKFQPATPRGDSKGDFITQNMSRTGGFITRSRLGSQRTLQNKAKPTKATKQRTKGVLHKKKGGHERSQTNTLFNADRMTPNLSQSDTMGYRISKEEKETTIKNEGRPKSPKTPASPKSPRSPK